MRKPTCKCPNKCHTESRHGYISVANSPLPGKGRKIAVCSSEQENLAPRARFELATLRSTAETTNADESFSRSLFTFRSYFATISTIDITLL